MIAVMLVVIYLLNTHTPKLIEYLQNDDVDGLTSYIRSEGNLGELILIGVQALETFSIVLPSLPVYICAGLIFGKLEGILICYITNLVLNAIMFKFARRGGQIGRERIANSKNVKTNKMIEKVLNMKNPEKAMIFLYIIPVIPNGLIPTLAAQTSIKFSHFIGELALFCLPSISICVICGDALLSIDWSKAIPILIALIAVAVLVYVFKNRITGWIEGKMK